MHNKKSPSSNFNEFYDLSIYNEGIIIILFICIELNHKSFDAISAAACAGSTCGAMIFISGLILWTF